MKKTWGNLYNIIFGSDLLDMTQEAQATDTSDKLEFIIIENCCLSRGTNQESESVSHRIEESVYKSYLFFFFLPF